MSTTETEMSELSRMLNMRVGMKMKNKRIAATATAKQEEERGKKRSGKSAHCSFVIYDSVALNSVLRVREAYIRRERGRTGQNERAFY